MSQLTRQIAAQENIPHNLLLKRLKEGTIIIPLNKRRKVNTPCAIGLGLRTKVNANIGTSTDKPDLKYELEKLRAAAKYGADTIMDLSVGGDLKEIRREIIKNSGIPVGTVPIYEIAVNAQERRNNLLDFSISDILAALESQARDGVDFFTVHCGVTQKSIAALKKHQRLLDIVSRGGAILAAWITLHKKENPFYEHFDRILDIAREYNITLSLGDGLRPGSIFDATDAAQISELKILGALARRARQKGVQVMIEGPGHVPLQDVRQNVLLEKKICCQAPFYCLGPLVTDAACGYDHITAAIGGALAAAAGADFICYVTPAEHLRHPSVDDVKEGVIASRIAAHAGDIAKGLKSALRWDREMSIARKKRDWHRQIKLSIDPEKAKKYRASSKPHLMDVCTMCGKYCSIKLIEECMRE